VSGFGPFGDEWFSGPLVVSGFRPFGGEWFSALWW